MPIEKSAGAVIFRKEPFDTGLRLSSAECPQGKEGKIYYLLLNYPSGAKSAKDYWDFPKGHLEKGEKEMDTAKREVEEETGLKDIKFVEGFKGWIKYFFKFEGKNIFKIVTFFLAETETQEVKISFEHKGFEWLEYEKATDRLSFKNAKEILKKANDFLISKN